MGLEIALGMHMTSIYCDKDGFVAWYYNALAVVRSGNEQENQSVHVCSHQQKDRAYHSYLHV